MEAELVASSHALKVIILLMRMVKKLNNRKHPIVSMYHISTLRYLKITKEHH